MFAKRIVALSMMVWTITISLVGAQQKFDAANIVRVAAGDSRGSGVYLGDRIVLTAAHVFEQEGRQAIVAFSDGSRIAGTLRSSDQVWDQAVVELSVAPTKAIGAPLAQANPAIGETVYAAGYPGGNSKLVWIAGQVNNYAAPDRSRPTDWFTFRGEAARAGASGGPVFNSNGEVIGNLWGSREVEMTTTATMCGRTRLFLNPFKGRLGRGQQGQAQAQGAAPRGRQIYIAPRQVGQSSGSCGSCGPNGCPVPGNRDVQIVPRDPGGEAPIIDGPPVVVQPPITTPQLDYNAIADLVFKKIQENPDAFRGPAGPPGEITADHINAVIDGLKNDESFAAKLQGPTGPAGPEGLPGKAGVDGKDGKDAQLTAEQMATMVAAILQNLKQDPTFVSELQGPPGPAGKDGEKGKDAQVTADQLATMSAAILKNLKNDNEFASKLKGPVGPEGPPGPVCDLTDLTARIDALEGTLVNIPDSEWSHLVLIADTKADYWPRLSGEFERAQGHWAKMRQVEPPDDRYIGPLPVLVAYTAGKPVQNWVGLRNVSQAFSNITRGDYDQFILAQK